MMNGDGFGFGAEGEGEVEGGEVGADGSAIAGAAAAAIANGDAVQTNGVHPSSGDAAGATVLGMGAGADRQANRERVTTPYLTKYERARVLGTRALQIRYVYMFFCFVLFLYVLTLFFSFFLSFWY